MGIPFTLAKTLKFSLLSFQTQDLGNVREKRQNRKDYDLVTRVENQSDITPKFVLQRTIGKIGGEKQKSDDRYYRQDSSTIRLFDKFSFLHVSTCSLESIKFSARESGHVKMQNLEV